jgi:hypothetical protein
MERIEELDALRFGVDRLYREHNAECNCHIWVTPALNKNSQKQFDDDYQVPDQRFPS